MSSAGTVVMVVNVLVVVGPGTVVVVVVVSGQPPLLKIDSTLPSAAGSSLRLKRRKRDDSASSRRPTASEEFVKIPQGCNRSPCVCVCSLTCSLGECNGCEQQYDGSDRSHDWLVGWVADVALMICDILEDLWLLAPSCAACALLAAALGNIAG